jgi:hypothetical protein
MVAALVLFAVGYQLDTEHAEIGAVIRMSALAGPFLGTLVTLATGDAGQMPMICLLVGGGLLLAESILENSLSVAIIAGSIILAAFDWLLVQTRVFEVQIYALPWTIYFAYLARRLHTSNSAHFAYMSLALATITLPIMAEASSEKGIFYGFEVIGVGLALAFIGSLTLNTLMMWWGVSVTVIEILYLVPKYFFPDSQLPLICGALGLVAIAVSVMAKMSREDSEAEDHP